MIDESSVPNTFTVTVPYRGASTIQDLVRTTHYDYVSASITDERFPQKETGDQEVTITLLTLGRPATTEEVLSEMETHGFRPANAAEILALGVAQPHVQRNFPVVSLGQIWHDARGNPCVVSLRFDGTEEYAILDLTGNLWRGRTRFPAVKKT